MDSKLSRSPCKESRAQQRPKEAFGKTQLPSHNEASPACAPLRFTWGKHGSILRIVDTILQCLG